VEFKDEKPNRIHWTSDDVEAGGAKPRPGLHRSNSIISINSVHCRRGSIDPASALPIQYRTVSFQIEESKEKNIAVVQKAKASAAKGTYLHSRSTHLTN
jgi:sodium/potassium-transporting ATPase subunit alpha